MVVRFSVQVSTASPDHAMAVTVVHFLVMVATAPMAATVVMPDELAMVVTAVLVLPEPLAPMEQLASQVMELAVLVETGPTVVSAELAAMVVRSSVTVDLAVPVELVATVEPVAPAVLQRTEQLLALVELEVSVVWADAEALAEMRPLVKTATVAMAETVDVRALVARVVMAGMPRLLLPVDVAVTVASVASPESAELVAQPVLVEPAARQEPTVPMAWKHGADMAVTVATASMERWASLARQVAAAATVHRQQRALLETAESVGLAAMAIQVRPEPLSQLHKQAQVVEQVGLAEPVARRHRELAVMAVLVVAAESVATAETVSTESEQTVQPAVSVALLETAELAVQPHLEWLDQVVPADLAAMAATVAKAVFLVTVVTLAMLDQVVWAALAVLQRLEPTGLLDLADGPEVVAPAEMAETETHSRAQAPTVEMVETAATLVQQAPDFLSDSPVTAATAVPAEPVGPELMEVTPTLPMPLAQVLLAGLVAMAATAERQRPELLGTAAMPELAAMAVAAATVSLPELIQTQEMVPMLALVVMAVTAVRQRPELLAMVATEPMLARPETADLRQAAATAPTAATAPAVATEALAVVPLVSTATAATADLHRTEEPPVTLAHLLDQWAVAAATAGLREQLVAPLVQRGQVQDQQEPLEPWELKAMVAGAGPAGPQPKQPPVAVAPVAQQLALEGPVR